MGTTGRYRSNGLRMPEIKPWESYTTNQSAFLNAFGIGYDTQGITQQILRGHMGASEVGVGNIVKGIFGYEEDVIQPDVANSISSKYGLKYDKPVRKSRLEIEIENKRKELIRQDSLNRIPDSWSKTSSVLAGGLAASFADPIELAASLVPVVGQARKAQLMAKLGVGKGRIATGVIEGSVGAALIEYPRYALTQKEQTDYTINDLMANIAFGGVLGGGLHYVGGRFSDKFNRQTDVSATPSQDLLVSERIGKTRIETKIDALRTAMSDAMSGRVINVEPILRMDQGYTGAFKNYSRIGSPDYRVPEFSLENQRRIESKIDNDISISFESKFDSRSDADKYIRNESKLSGSERTDYLIERGDDGKVDVYRIRNTSVVSDDLGSPIIFDGHNKAKAFVDERNAQSVGEGSQDRFYIIPTKEKAGKAGQEFMVIKGVNLSDADINKIKNTPAFFRPVESPELGPVISDDISKILKNFNAEKVDPNNSHVIRNIQKTPDPKNYSNDVAEIDEYMLSDEEDVDLLFKNIEDQIDDDSLKSELSSVRDEIKKLSDDVSEFEKLEANIVALAKCMAG